MTLATTGAFAFAIAVACAGCATLIGADFDDKTLSGSGGSASATPTASSSDASSTGASGANGGASSSPSVSASVSATATASASSSGGGGGSCVGTDVCVPAAPLGWSGPIALETGAGMNPPACSEPGWSIADPAASGGTGAVVAPPDCTMCQCTGPSGGDCPTSAALNTYGTTNCLGGKSPFTATTSCQQPVIIAAASGSPTKATNVMCVPSSSDVITPASFASSAAACSGGVGAACAGGVCAKPASRLCIYTTGMQSCATPGYTNPIVVFGGISDNRKCTLCSCVANGVMCVPTTDVFATSDCTSGFLGSVVHDGSCAIFGGQATPGVKISDPGTPTGGSCAAVGGAPMGSASGSKPVTLCCSTP